MNPAPRGGINHDNVTLTAGKMTRVSNKCPELMSDSLICQKQWVGSRINEINPLMFPEGRKLPFNGNSSRKVQLPVDIFFTQ